MNLEKNSKLISFTGIIGRRDYFLNFVYICMISAFIAMPQQSFVIKNISTFDDILKLNQIIYTAPVALKIWLVFSLGFLSVVSISNAIRRLSDIQGRINNIFNIIASIVIVLGIYSIFFPVFLAIVFALVSFALNICLLFTKGQITAKEPHDITKEFNWGAFLGTWIWGLINNSYKPLWFLLLCLTPAGFYFQLVCGIKGNEWAYKNRLWENDEKFLDSQRTQSLVFIIVYVLIIPVITILLVIFMFILIAGIAAAIAQSEPAGAANVRTKAPIERIQSGMETFSSLYFESYTITLNENKFYIDPKDWAGSSFKEKKTMLDMASTIAAGKKMKKYKGRSFSKTTELPRTKIYNSKNKELLAEFHLDENALNKKEPNFKDIVSMALKAYRFYNPTVK